MVFSLLSPISLQPLTRFTGLNPCVNPAGKSLGSFASSFPEPVPVKTGMTRKPCGLGSSPQGHLRLNPYQEINMSFPNKQIKHKQPDFLPFQSYQAKVFLMVFFIGFLLCPQELWAHTGDLLKDEIEKVEKLFTGGYMRLGLLAVCGFAAIYGIVKQNGWIFASGILGCVFAYFMKDWILKTFTMVI